ncbi:MAG: site-specific integrase [Ignavibacteriae bacterium]|nr:site-specific integrase [Ignavibacteriota bacterium]
MNYEIIKTQEIKTGEVADAGAVAVIRTGEKVKEIINGLDISEASRADYLYQINNFLGYVADKQIGSDTLLNYKRELQKILNLSVSTKNKYLTTAKVYLKELHRKGILPVDITVNVKQFKQTRKHKKFGLNENEVKKFLTVVEKKCSTKDKAIFYLAALQGLREVEITRIEATDIDFDNGKLLILGKGRDDKEPVNLHPKTLQVLKEYIHINNFKTGRIFDLTERTLRNRYHRIADVLGIKSGMHGFRKNFVSQMIKILDGDLMEVMKYSRHNSLDMLVVYNDNIEHEKTLPKYYEGFNNLIPEEDNGI